MTPQQQAAAAALKRRGIRGSFLEFCKYALPRGLVPAAHHRLVIDTLQQVARGMISRVMVFAPPASGKSIYVSALFPAWFMAMHPEKNILACSHTYELAESFGRAVRKYITEHSAVLGISLSRESQAAGNWANDKGGKYFAAGVGGAITGRRGIGGKRRLDRTSSLRTGRAEQTLFIGSMARADNVGHMDRTALHAAPEMETGNLG